MYDHVKSINSVTTTVHEVTVKNVLVTDVRYYLLMSVSHSSLFTLSTGLLISHVHLFFVF